MNTLTANPCNLDTPPAEVSFWQAFLFWLKLGFISFGGLAGQIAIMHQELVERRRWISERRFACTELLHGAARPRSCWPPTSAGRMHRTWAVSLPAACSCCPSLFILIGLSRVHIAFGDVPLVAGLFYGIKPAVTAIVVQAAHRIGSRALKNNVPGPLPPPRSWPSSHSTCHSWPSSPWPPRSAISAVGCAGQIKAGGGHGKAGQSFGSCAHRRRYANTAARSVCLEQTAQGGARRRPAVAGADGHAERQLRLDHTPTQMGWFFTGWLRC